MSQKPKIETKTQSGFKELTLDHKHHVFLGQEAPKKGI